MGEQFFHWIPNCYKTHGFWKSHHGRSTSAINTFALCSLPSKPSQAAACHPGAQPAMPFADTSQPSRVQGLLVADSCQSSEPKSSVTRKWRCSSARCQMLHLAKVRSMCQASGPFSFRKPYIVTTNIFPKQWHYLTMPFIMQWVTDLLILSLLFLFHARKWKMWIPVVQLLHQI